MIWLGIAIGIVLTLNVLVVIAGYRWHQLRHPPRTAPIIYLAAYRRNAS